MIDFIGLYFLPKLDDYCIKASCFWICVMQDSNTISGGKSLLLPRWVAQVFAFLGPYVFAYPAIAWAFADLTDGYLLALALVFAFIYFAIAIHEAGHSLVALSVGWRVHLIVISNIAFSPRQRRFLRIARTAFSNDVGGWVLATPGPLGNWIRGRALYVLAGPGSNILIGLILLLLAVALGEENRLSFGLSLGLGEISLVIGVANLLPTASRAGTKSDGAHLIEIMRGIELTPFQKQASRLLGQLYDGVPTRDWEVGDINELIRSSGTEEDNLRIILLSYAFSNADLTAVRSILEELYRKNPAGLPELRCTYAFVLAMTGAGAGAAAEVLNSLPKTIDKNSFEFWRARAVVDHLLQRRDDAVTAVEKAIRAAKKSGHNPDSDDLAVFEAIDSGRVLPTLPPRVQLKYDNDAPAKSMVVNI